MKKTTASIDKYLDSLPEDMRVDMQALDREISKIIPERTLWKGIFWGGTEQTIIGYGDCVYTRPNKEDVEWFMVGLALQKNYISLYVNATEDGQYAVKKRASRLGKAKFGSASISFKKLSDLDLSELKELFKLAGSQTTH